MEDNKNRLEAFEKRAINIPIVTTTSSLKMQFQAWLTMGKKLKIEEHLKAVLAGFEKEKAKEIAELIVFISAEHTFIEVHATDKFEPKPVNASDGSKAAARQSKSESQRQANHAANAAKCNEAKVFISDAEAITVKRVEEAAEMTNHYIHLYSKKCGFVPTEILVDVDNINVIEAINKALKQEVNHEDFGKA